MEALLILGASARAAAFSALRAGLRPNCIDLFADLDLQQRCPVRRLSGRYPHAFLDHLDAMPPGPWMYTGGLENWPRLVQQLAERRPLWGNAAASLRRARRPEFVAGVLQAAGMPAPALGSTAERSDTSRRWLCKPRKSAGGSGIRFADEARGAESAVYCQEYIDGRPCSLLFVGDGRRARLLGMTWQLIGVSFLHAGEFRYCGSIGPVDPAVIRRPDPRALGDVLAEACGLRGLFGVDGVLREGVFWPVEINPRYTASVEVLEYAAGWAALAQHAHAFTQDTLPPPLPSAMPARYVGKAILFARADLMFPQEGPWLDELRSPSPLEEPPAFADIPAAGQPIPAGKPILTFFVRGGSVEECAEELRRRAEALDCRLFGG